jgi:glycosyltransferase involved in cell wall biosynthesis
MPAFYVVCGLWAAWRLGRRERYDVVHVHWPVPHALFGWAVQRACGARMVTSWYGAELRWVKGSLPWLRPFVRWALAASDQVVAISSHTAREIAEFSKVQPRVIPYTIGFAEAKADVAGAGPRDGFGVLFVGRLVERKGVRYLIDAVQRMAPERRARLVIIGDGPERERLEEQVRGAGLEGQVEVRGRVSDRELRQAYADSNVFVLPAIVDTRGDTEGLGVVLLEAMVYRIPVIASDLGGITDIVTPGETGLLVPPADAAALGAALERLAADPALAQRLGNAGHQILSGRFSWPTIVAQWEACYAAALSGARAGK